MRGLWPLFFYARLYKFSRIKNFARTTHYLKRIGKNKRKEKQSEDSASARHDGMLIAAETEAGIHLPQNNL